MKKILGVYMAAASLSVGAATTVEELEKKIEAQQAEIELLKKGNQDQDARINQTADALESVGQAGNGGRWFDNTTLGGYAEMHYNSLDNQGDAGTGSDVDEIDFHRFVLFLSHAFNENTRFVSELELEHSIAGEGQNGEIELEQAYVEHDYVNGHRFKTGLFLVPVGTLNETHEPNIFYGVERNPVEREIIPTTWWEGGLAFSGELGRGVSYDTAFTSGLFIDTAGGDYKVRSGRQKVSEAKADDGAFTGRIKYTGVPGLEMAVSTQYQHDVTQGEATDRIDGHLVEGHVVYQAKGFGLKGLYAQWDFDSALNDVSEGASKQKGWYVEPSYRFNEKFGVFIRYNEYDNLAAANVDGGMRQIDTGFNYWLHPKVALKADYQNQNPEESGARELDGVNLGVGVQF